MLDAEDLDVTVRIRRAQRVLRAAVPTTPTQTDEAARILQARALLITTITTLTELTPVQRATVDADPDVQAALARIETQEDDPLARRVIMAETGRLPPSGESSPFWGSVTSDGGEAIVEVEEADRTLL